MGEEPRTRIYLLPSLDLTQTFACLTMPFSNTDTLKLTTQLMCAFYAATCHLFFSLPLRLMCIMYQETNGPSSVVSEGRGFD